jgi:hypothetical protein
MKITAFFFLAFVACAFAGPVKITENNVGDIITVGIKGSIDISNEIDQDIVNVIVGILNRQTIGIGGGSDVPTPAEVPQTLKMNITPEMIEQFKELFAKH